jgi:hypothetical protein
MIFVHAIPDQWRDGPGFNTYFLRAGFPSVTVETEYDWRDRVELTSAPGMFFFSFSLSVLTASFFVLFLKPAALPPGLGTSRSYFLPIALQPSEDHIVDPKTSASSLKQSRR